ncbi:hypothetical protein PY650_05860 [Rhizobium calliandrae]|uniref:Uncharacterized protein n=1 Tax=Rhizobium calliandrae TaxID=1312182 RepID=A0ABT7K995_9HYPH|nr:hypothetical protein [Rhizobium calliandrae]MDL2405186.1 hypothetical protein [Rhizobium calliandrae]
MKPIYIAWAIRLAIEALTIAAIAAFYVANAFDPSPFLKTFLIIYGVWYGFCFVMWFYRNIADWIVYRLTKQMFVDEEVKGMELCKLPVDQFPYEELGTYLDRIVEDPAAPGIAKAKVGYYTAILERAQTSGFLYRMRLERVLKEARIKYKQLHGEHL